ncbi:MAG: hypothetical protein ABIN79_03070 [Marmoricola sp.]
MSEIPEEPMDGVRTGHQVVDGVVDSLAGLDERPVGEHVAVFEQAHDSLRRALNEAGTATPGTRS